MDIHVAMSVDSGIRLEFQREVTIHWQPLTFRWYLGLDERRGPTDMVDQRGREQQRKRSSSEENQDRDRRRPLQADQGLLAKKMVKDVPAMVNQEKRAPCTQCVVSSCQTSLV